MSSASPFETMHSTFYSYLRIPLDTPDEEMEERIEEYLKGSEPLEHLPKMIQTAVEVLGNPQHRNLYRGLLQAASNRTPIPGASFRGLAEEWGFVLVEDPRHPTFYYVFFEGEAPIDDTFVEEVRPEAVVPEDPGDFLHHLAHLLGFARGHLKAFLVGGVGVLLLVAGVIIVPRVKAHLLRRSIETSLAEDRAVLLELTTSFQELVGNHEKLLGTPLRGKLSGEGERSRTLAAAILEYPTVEAAAERLRACTLTDEALRGFEAVLVDVDERVKKGEFQAPDEARLRELLSPMKEALDACGAHHEDLGHISHMMDVVRYDQAPTKGEGR